MNTVFWLLLQWLCKGHQRYCGRRSTPFSTLSHQNQKDLQIRISPELLLTARGCQSGRISQGGVGVLVAPCLVLMLWLGNLGDACPEGASSQIHCLVGCHLVRGNPSQSAQTPASTRPSHSLLQLTSGRTVWLSPRVFHLRDLTPRQSWIVLPSWSSEAMSPSCHLDSLSSNLAICSLSFDLLCGHWSNSAGRTMTAFITTHSKAVAEL